MNAQGMMQASPSHGRSDEARADSNFNHQQTGRGWERVSIRKVFFLAALVILALATKAPAIVFDLSPTNGLMPYNFDVGAGQGVIVNTTQNITDMGFLPGPAEWRRFEVHDLGHYQQHSAVFERAESRPVVQPLLGLLDPIQYHRECRPDLLVRHYWRP